MIQTKTITARLGGKLGAARVEFESKGITDMVLHRINGTPADQFSFADQVAVQGKLAAAMMDELVDRAEVRL